MYFNNYNTIPDSFMGYYITDYSTVLNAPVPSNGQAVLFANLDEGLLWSKKIMGNQAYIQEYKIEPVNKIGAPPAENDILSELKYLREEIQKLKEDKHEHE